MLKMASPAGACTCGRCRRERPARDQGATATCALIKRFGQEEEAEVAVEA